MSGQVKLKEEQVQFYKKEAGRLNEDKQDLNIKLKEKSGIVADLTSKQKQLYDEINNAETLKLELADARTAKSKV